MAPSRYRVPRSLGLFGLAFFAFLLQVPPGLGKALLYLLAPFWSVILVNVGMVGIVVEAWSGQVGRFWLALPLAYFGGYMLCVGAGQMNTKQLTTDAAAAYEQATATPRDIVGHPLVAATPELARSLFETFDLPEIYWFDEKSSKYRVRRSARGALCEALLNKGPKIGVSVYKISAQSEKNGLCIYSFPLEPKPPMVTIAESAPIDRWLFGLHIIDRRVSIRDAAGTSISFIHGEAEPLGMRPLPVIGCSPADGMDGWQCSAFFLSVDVHHFGPNSADAIARLLGIPRLYGTRRTPTFEIERDPDLGDLTR